MREILKLPKPAERAEPKENAGYVLLYYFHTIGAASLVLGAAGLVADISFIIWAGFIYSGLVILCIDPWVDPLLKKSKLRLRLIPTAAFLVALVAFTRYVVFLPAQLEIRATDYNGDFPLGRKIGGKEMRPEYSTLHVSFRNPTEHDLKDLDFVVATDQYVISAESNLATVIVFNTVAGPDTLNFSNKDNSGNISYEDESHIQLLSGGIRVLCDRLPRDTTFDITIAIANVPSAGTRAVPPSSDDLLALKGDDLAKAFGPRTAAKKVGLSGWYKSLGQRPHRLRQVYEVKQL